MRKVYDEEIFRDIDHEIVAHSIEDVMKCHNENIELVKELRLEIYEEYSCISKNSNS